MRASVYSPSPSATTDPVIEESGLYSSDAASARSLTSAAPPQLSVFTPSSPLPSVTQSPSSPAFSNAARSPSDQTFSPYHGSAAAVAASVFARPSSSIGGHGYGHGVFDNAADSNSIRSGRSLSSSTSQGASKHPVELTSPGINASSIETVSAWFEHGLCTRSVVIGEVGLAYNPVSAALSSQQESIRLEGFEKLEKVAPNPAFISDSGIKGEYTVTTSHLQRMNVAFKYQVAAATGSNAGELAPLLLTTSWKISQGNAMCILSYSLNPAFTLHAGTSSVELKNVNLILQLGTDGAKATSCMSKPVGTFDRTRNIIYWALGDIALSAGGAPTKLLAKFGTGEGEAKQGHVEAKWEVVGGVGSGLDVVVKDEAENGEADPFADERASTEAVWKSVGGSRKLCGGTYHAQ